MNFRGITELLRLVENVPAISIGSEIWLGYCHPTIMNSLEELKGSIVFELTYQIEKSMVMGFVIDGEFLNREETSEKLGLGCPSLAESSTIN